MNNRIVQFGLGRRLVCTAVLNMDFLAVGTKQGARRPFPSIIDPKGPIPNGEFLPMEIRIPLQHHQSSNNSNNPIGKFSENTLHNTFGGAPGYGGGIKSTEPRSYVTIQQVILQNKEFKDFICW